MSCLNSKYLYIYDIERLIKAEKGGAIKSIANQSNIDVVATSLSKFLFDTIASAIIELRCTMR
jgi:hypothetical protein